MTVVSERVRVGACAAAGILVAGIAAAVTIWEIAVLVGWVVTTATLLGWTWSDIWPLDAEQTQAHATVEDDSRATARLILITASVASLVAVVVALRRASDSTGTEQWVLTTVAVMTVVSSWLVVHTVFALRYTHLYYGGTTIGGVAFPGDEAPTYRDFAYLAFTVGMTYQVSDTDITHRDMRGAVLRHAGLSFIFGVAIIASAINVVAGLVG